jgi:hypothetical protein
MTVTEKQFEIIKAAAFDQDALLQQAFVDAVEAFAKGTMCNRTTAESIRVLHNWAATFRRLEKQP